MRSTICDPVALEQTEKANATRSGEPPGRLGTVAWIGAGAPVDALRERGVVTLVASASAPFAPLLALAPDLLVLGEGSVERWTEVIDALREAPTLGCVPVAVVDRGTREARAVGRYGLVARWPAGAAPTAIAGDVEALLRARHEPPLHETVSGGSDLLEAWLGGLRGRGAAAFVVAPDDRSALLTGRGECVPEVAVLLGDSSVAELRIVELPAARARRAVGAHGGSLRGARVVIVHNDDRAARGWREALEKGGAQVEVVEANDESRATAHKLVPSVIVISRDALHGPALHPWEDERSLGASFVVVEDDAVGDVVAAVADAFDAERATTRALAAGEVLRSRLETFGAARWLKVLGEIRGAITFEVRAAAGTVVIELAKQKIKRARFEPTTGDTVQGKAALGALLALRTGRVAVGTQAQVLALTDDLPPEALPGSAEESVTADPPDANMPVAEAARNPLGAADANEDIEAASDAGRASAATDDAGAKADAEDQGKAEDQAKAVAQDGAKASAKAGAKGEAAGKRRARRRRSKRPGPDKAAHPDDAGRGPESPVAKEKPESLAAKERPESRDAKERPESLVAEEKLAVRTAEEKRAVRTAEEKRAARARGETPAPVEVVEALPTDLNPRRLVIGLVVLLVIALLALWAFGDSDAEDDTPAAGEPTRAATGPDPGDFDEARPNPAPDPGTDFEVEADPSIEPADDLGPEDPDVDLEAPDLDDPDLHVEDEEDVGSEVDLAAAGAVSADPHALLRASEAAYTEGDREGSAALARLAVQRAPDNAGAHYQLARALRRLGLDDVALEEAERATELAPESGVYHMFIGDLHARHGRTASALRAYERCTQEQPNMAACRERIARHRNR